VFVNHTGTKLSKTDYVGVYVFEDRIKRGSDRVDIAKLKPDDNTEPRITAATSSKKITSIKAADRWVVKVMAPARTAKHARRFSHGTGGFPADAKGFGPAARVTRTVNSSSSRSSRTPRVVTNHLASPRLAFRWTRIATWLFATSMIR